MKPLKVIALLVAGLMLTVSQVWAATTTPFPTLVDANESELLGFQNIDTLRITESSSNSSRYTISLNMLGALSDVNNLHTIYEVVFAADSAGLFVHPEASTEAVTFRFSRSNSDLQPFFPAGSVAIYNFQEPTTSNPNTLSWDVDKTAISTYAWYGAQTLNDTIVNGIQQLQVLDRVSNTPIPGAAWLLGSGLIGLLGLKRKRVEMT